MKRLQQQGGLARARARRLAPPAGWLAGALLGLFIAPAADAAVSCSVTANPIAFGVYNTVSRAAVTTTTTFTLNCTGPGNLNAVFSLSPGQSGVQTARYLASGANRLTYQVYKDSRYTQIFGDGTGGTYTFSASTTVTNAGVTGTATVYGSIAADQTPLPGTYTDTLTLQISY